MTASGQPKPGTPRPFPKPKPSPRPPTKSTGSEATDFEWLAESDPSDTPGGWEVRAWGARPVFYPTRGQAVRVARQVLGGTVHRARPPAPSVAAVVKRDVPSLAVNLRGWSHTLGGTR